MFTLSGKRIWVAGHNGLVGRAVVRALEGVRADVLTVSRRHLDLRDQAATHLWIKNTQPDAIILAAATVGGIGDNQARPVDFLYDNLMIEAHVIRAAYEAGVEKLLFLGSSCIYPRDAMQPVVPEALMTGALEHTNEAYALAKIAGIKLCQAYQAQYGARFITAMPCNLYGPGDRFDAVRSHVIPALMLKMHQARLTGQPTVDLWGSGTPLREFLHVDDLARGLLMLLEQYEGREPVNVGSGDEVTIADLAAQLKQVTGYGGQIVFNAEYPDGTLRKVLDSSIIRSLGWKPEIGLMKGLQDTYEWFCAQPALAKQAA